MFESGAYAPGLEGRVGERVAVMGGEMTWYDREPSDVGTFPRPDGVEECD
jgi:hypothetical protein